MAQQDQKSQQQKSTRQDEEKPKRDTTLNIHQRILAVMADVTHVKKDVEVGQGRDKYPAVSHDEVVSRARKAFIEHGIVLEPRQVHDEGLMPEVVPGQTSSGKDRHRYQSWYEVAFVNVDDPKDRITTRVQVHADDMGDKAPGKAYTYAVKYAVLKQLALPSGEDDEERVEEDEPQYITDEQVQHLDELIREAEINRDDLFKWARISQLDELTTPKYPRVERELQRRVAKNRQNQDEGKE